MNACARVRTYNMSRIAGCAALAISAWTTLPWPWYAAL